MPRVTIPGQRQCRASRAWVGAAELTGLRVAELTGARRALTGPRAAGPRAAAPTGPLCMG